MQRQVNQKKTMGKQSSVVLKGKGASGQSALGSAAYPDKAGVKSTVSLMAQSASTSATAPSADLAAQLDAKLERDARVFLEEILGIPAVASERRGKTWTCLSCLLSKVYDLFCRAGPEGDAEFFREVQGTKFE